MNCSLKVPGRYDKCLRVSSSVKEKSLPAPYSGREWATSYTVNVGGDRMNPGIRILPLPITRTSRMADDWVEVRSTSCPQDGKLSLCVDESPTSQRHEDVKRKREFYNSIIFPERISRK